MLGDETDGKYSLIGGTIVRGERRRRGGRSFGFLRKVEQMPFSEAGWAVRRLHTYRKHVTEI